MMLTIYLILISLISILFYIMRFPSYRTYRLAQKLPGENMLSIFGHTFELAQHDLTTVLPYFMTKFKKLETRGRLFRVWFLGIPMVCPVNPDIIKEVLGNDRNLKKGWEYDYFHSWIGSKSVFTASGSEWKVRRAVVNTPLTSRLIEKIGAFNEHAKKMVRKILSENQNETDVLFNASIFSLNSACETLMGVELDQESDEGKKYVKSLKHILESINYRVLNGIYMKDWMFKFTPLGRFFDYYTDINNEFVKKVIRKRMERYRNKSIPEENADTDIGIKTNKAIIDSVIENGTVYGTEEEIVQETNFLMFAAHDTTAVTLHFALFCLANNKEVQEKVFKEQESIFGTSKRDVTNEDIKKMTYLSLVIKETLRMYPTVPYLSRELQEDVKYEDLIIPKGCNLMILPMIIHRMPEFFPEPDKFDPERFSPEECKKRHPYTYFPFSGGPRYCPGQKYAEMTLKVFLSTLIRNFELHPVTKQEDVVIKLTVVLLTEKPIKVKFIPRNQDSINYHM